MTERQNNQRFTSAASGGPAGLLCVDVGLQTAFACFDAEGKLVWLQSRRLPSQAVLRRAIPSLLKEMPPFSAAILEGGGHLTKIWQKELEQLAVDVEVVHAEQWRADLLHPREQRSGALAKESAFALFAELMSWSGLKGPMSQQHDAAEAALCGFWYLLKNGSAESAPAGIQQRFNASASNSL